MHLNFPGKKKKTLANAIQCGPFIFFLKNDCPFSISSPPPTAPQETQSESIEQLGERPLLIVQKSWAWGLLLQAWAGLGGLSLPSLLPSVSLSPPPQGGSSPKGPLAASGSSGTEGGKEQ